MAPLAEQAARTPDGIARRSHPQAMSSSSQVHRTAAIRFLIRAPRAGLRGNWRKLADRANAYLLNPWRNVRRLRDFQATRVGAEEGHYYVIAVPGTLHYLLPCLGLIRHHVRVVVIDNGLTAWERAYLARRLPRVARFRLALLPGSLLSHGRVLNLLFAANQGNFGILDHDTYILRPALLQGHRPTPDEPVIALWSHWNEPARVRVPRTFFMYFHTPVIKSVMARYRVGMQVYQRVPRRLRPKLHAFGFTPDNPPKAYLGAYDATDLTLALCFTEGLRPRYPPFGRDTAVHLGGTSHAQDPALEYTALRLLEFNDDQALTARYRPMLSSATTSAEALSRVPRERAAKLEGAVDGLLARIAARIG